MFLLSHPPPRLVRVAPRATRLWARLLIFVVSAYPLLPAQALPAAPSQSGQPAFKFTATTELVVVNVVVRDRQGRLVSGLKADDFTVLEDGKPQRITTFDNENVATAPVADIPMAPLLKTAAHAAAGTPAVAATAAPNAALRDRRLMVFFFDLSSMQPEEIDRATTAAQHYLDTQMSPADLVAVVSLATNLQVNQDFTQDRRLLHAALQAVNPSAGQGFQNGGDGTTEGTPDTGNPYTPDETEFNVFNTDRKLDALQSISNVLAHVNEKKSLIYFTGGLSSNGLDNQSELRASINAAVRANLAVYPMDMRGLQALPPGGEASQASLRGVSPYSGASMQGQRDSNFASQETLTTLAGDTGGRAFLDSNNFTEVFSRVQQDTSAYYVLGYHSTNPIADGRFRKLSVRLRRPDLKLEYRAGYYAGKDFKHYNTDDRETQMQDELAAALPATDVKVYLAASYFRLANGKFYVPIALVVPGSEIPFTRSSDQDKATLDIAGLITDELKRPVSDIRKTIKLTIAGAEQVQQKNVQYNTAVVLPAGDYHLKFVVRENQTGRLGAFETDLVIPEIKKETLRLSSVLLASQISNQAAKNKLSPLIYQGRELIPNISHVFSQNQHLYLYYEVYDPAKDTRPALAAAATKPVVLKNPVRVLSSVAFFFGKRKAYETPLVEARQLNAPERHAVIFELDVPLAQLRPGFYTCQINLIDDVAGKFVFPRFPVLVRP